MKTIHSIIVVWVSLLAAASGWAQGTWTTNKPMKVGVALAQAVSYAGQMYVVGGDGTAPQVYDPTTDSWTNKTSEPYTRAATVAGVISNKIYVAEGWINADGNNPTSALEIYDPAKDSWNAGQNSLIARGTAASAVIGGKLYITGGNVGFYSGDIATLEIYNPNTDTWSMGAPIPVPAEEAVGAAINGKFYVVGGNVRVGHPVAPTANMYIYDPVTNGWTTGTPMPAPRWGAVGGVIEGKLYITGGNASDATQTNNPVIIYDPATSTWSTGTPEPDPRQFGVAAVLNNKLFVAGGNANGGIGNTKALDLEVYSPAPQLYIAIVGPQTALLWDASATNFVLQTTTNLSSSNWSSVSNGTPVIGAVLTPSSPSAFFRLQAQ